MIRFSALLVGLLVVSVGLAAAGAFWLAGAGESAGAEHEVTLQAVAEHPRELDGRRVTVSGEVAEYDYFSLADAHVVFAIGDDAGRELLVYPRAGVGLPDLSENTVVRVEGTVNAVQSNERTSGGLLDQARVLSRSGTEAAIQATAVDIPASKGDELPSEGTPRTATVRRVLADPRAWNDRPVVVPGSVAEILASGFVLAGDRRSIFVGAPGCGARRVATRRASTSSRGGEAPQSLPRRHHRLGATRHAGRGWRRSARPDADRGRRRVPRTSRNRAASGRAARSAMTGNGAS